MSTDTPAPRASTTADVRPVTPSDVEDELQHKFVARMSGGDWHVAARGNHVKGVATGCGSEIAADDIGAFERWADAPISIMKMCPHCIKKEFDALSNGVILYG